MTKQAPKTGGRAHRCAECGTINHKKSCVTGNKVRQQRAQRMLICTGQRDNGAPCGNKRVRGSNLCHWHDPLYRKKNNVRTTSPLLFYVMFLYGLRAHWSESHLWSLIARDTFQGLLTGPYVRKYHVAYQRWEHAHDKSQGIDALHSLFKTPPVDHFFRHFSLASLDLLIQHQSIVDINGIQYRFTDTSLERLGKFPFPQQFLFMQAFDGYRFDEASNMMVPIMSRRHCIQAECQGVLSIAGTVAACPKLASNPRGRDLGSRARPGPLAASQFGKTKEKQDANVGQAAV